MHKKIRLIFLFVLGLSSISAQQQPINFFLQLQAGYNGPDNIPFWIRSNKFGSVPPPGASLNLTVAIKKDYDPTQKKKIDWGFGVEGRLDIGNPTEFNLPEAYGKIKGGIFELKAGRTKDIIGLCDTTLSSGSWSVSGNAPGIPQIQLSIPEYFTLPIFGGIFAIKGSYVHGWMGNWYLRDEVVKNSRTFLHQKTLYGRIGKSRWKLNLYAGFNHLVVWGLERQIMGEDYDLTPFQTFLYINSGKEYSKGTIANTRLGNHLGSLDLGITYDFRNVRLFIYRQNLYDAGALYYLANLRDGLNGISLTHKKKTGKVFQWNKLVFEFLYTKNQGGETWSPHTTSPYENYYNNFYYPAGWSYKRFGIGNPFISLSGTIREDLPDNPSFYFLNNRVIALHTGFDLQAFEWNFTGKFSFSRNYGTYRTSPDGKIFGGKNTEALFGIFPVSDQFSGYLEIRKNLSKGIQVGIITAFDAGELYYNSFGLMGMLSRSF